ncbi:SPRY domain-containing protein [Paenibacillus polymyxa]|uniref:SPRY domain-containing protein n=1 Tax=Paenibacillus polymyxa TaxID=1406 RepID=UPI000410E408|nr:SPRY domain-containing protein [Paenibacillus polymyxa]
MAINSLITWDSINKGSTTVLSNGNLSATTPSSSVKARCSVGKTSGKWYWEISFSGTFANPIVGILNDFSNLNSNDTSSTYVRGYYVDGRKSPEWVAYGAKYISTDTISVLLDLDNGSLEFWKNGITQGVSHTNILSMGPVYPFVSSGQSSSDATVMTANFGASTFKYTPPTGFLPYAWEMVDKFLILKDDIAYGAVPMKPLVPKLKSAVGENGSVISSGAYTPNWFAFDGDNISGYATNFVPSAGAPAYVGYKFNTPVTVKKYEFLAGLIDFKLMASNDGVSWVTLDTKTNIPVNMTTVQSYIVPKASPYYYYKLEMTKATSLRDWVTFFVVQFYDYIPVVITPTFEENDYSAYGFVKEEEIDLDNKHSHILIKTTKNSSVGSGKVFKHSISEKNPIKNVSIT